MKKLTFFTLAILMVPLLLKVHAQEYIWYSSSNFYEPQIIFTNPAGISFREHRQAIFSSQLLFTGLENDNLYNHYLGFIDPIPRIGVVGIRGSYFNSHLLKQGTLSLLYGSRLLKSQLGFGFNINFHHYSYDSDNFQLLDADDPLLAKGTSSIVFSTGLGVIYSPLTDLYLGMSLDNLNQPDISLEGSKARKPLLANFGLCYRIYNLVPEFDVRYIHNSQKKETYYVFGLKQMLLDNSANLSFQFQKDFFSIGGAYSLNNLRLDYNYTYPLNDLQKVSAGSHQFTLCYNFGDYWGYPTAPKINILSPIITEVDSNYFRFQAQVEDNRGLQQITIELNGENLATYDYPQKEWAVTIENHVFPLREGENTIKIIASNDLKKSSKDIKITYKPFEKTPETVPVIVSTPKIAFLTPLEKETNTSILRIKFTAEFDVDLNDIKTKINGKEIKLIGIRPLSKKKDKMELEVELDLEEGMNKIEVIAYDSRGKAYSEKRTIRYNPITEPLYNQLWAVVVGIDDYIDNDVNDLNYAVYDAKGIEKLLKENFNFDHIISIYNREATKDNIIRALSTNLKEVNHEDGVFIFFSGHGCTGKGIDGNPLGFIVPADGTIDKKELYYVKNIPMTIIREISQSIKAKHIYYVMDCCYGGLLFRDGTKKKAPPSTADYGFILSLAKKQVRQALTAGGEDDPVLDNGPGNHSVFTGTLIQGLQGEADSNKDGFITAEELNFFIRQRVYKKANILMEKSLYRFPAGKAQMPRYGKWFGEGEFIFYSKDH